MVAGQPAEFRRERTGRHDVRHRKQETLLVFQPWLGLVMLACGTGPVLPGVGAVVVRLAGLTMIDLAAEGFRAAPFHVLHGPQMTGSLRSRHGARYPGPWLRTIAAISTITDPP